MIEILNVTKRYGAIVALNDISLNFKKGEIHALLGKNGAGKSTFVNILYGRISPTSGRIYINNTEIDFRRYQPNIAQKMKISLVPQEPLFAEDLTIEDNLFLGAEMINKLKNLNRKDMRKKTIEVLEQVGLESYSPTTKVSNMPIGDRQLLNIGQVLYLKETEILLLDEISSGLSEERMRFISEQLKKERKKNKTIIFISHRLKEVINLCDRITVFRDGKWIITEDIENISLDKLTNYIIGENTKTYTTNNGSYFKNHKEKPLLEVNNLCIDHYVSNVNLKIYNGEVIGIAGLVGSGGKQFMESIGGIIRPTQGEIIYKGKKVSFSNPNNAIKEGIVYLSDDREGDIIFSDFSIKDNSIIGSWEKISNCLGINSKKELELFYTISKKLKLKYDNFYDNIGMLSGGNRQKVGVGRLIIMNPSIFILNEPTKGIDVGVKYELLELIREKLTKSSSIILSTPEIEELIMIADRIVVFYKGLIQRVISRSEFSEKTIFKELQGDDK